MKKGDLIIVTASTILSDGTINTFDYLGKITDEEEDNDRIHVLLSKSNKKNSSRSLILRKSQTNIKLYEKG